jgi:poly(3-hydroxybutyrate) depolymerase
MIITFAACNKKTDTSTPTTPTPVITDSATVTVVGGYGSGKYKVGDTVNIWAVSIPTNSIFDTWSGYSNLLSNSGEWHNSFVMPAQNVTITGSTKLFPAYNLVYQQIKGKNNLKNVYYYFPPGHKGIVYLLHGTSGSASNLVNNFEWIQMMNALVSENYAIIVTEAEEVTLNTDINGDGSIRWNPTPVDTVANVDYANIKAITDTFYNRGYSNRSIPRYSIGMSNGGEFSTDLSYVYSFKTGVSYCAPSGGFIATTTLTPLQYCMAKYDDNPNVGPQGNANALSNSQTLSARNICSKYFAHDHSPLYPERFARRPDISITTSVNMTTELRKNNWLDAKNYFIAPSSAVSADIKAKPANYPVFISLNVAQQYDALNQIDIMYAAHQFYSDYNKTTIKFLNTQCQ